MKNLLRLCFMISLLLIGVTYQSCTPKTADKVSTTKDTATDLIGVAESKADAGPPVVLGMDLKGPVPVDPDVRIGTLPNGMKYYIRKNSKPENRAEIRLAVNAGAMQEDDDQQGLAHFVEHMAFNGSKNFEKSELVDYLETVGTRFGPDLNAYTSFDETVYMLQARTDDQEMLDKGMLIMEDWANGVTFEDEEIDKERGVVESEWRSRLSPQQRMMNEYFPIMYKGSRYANRLPIGKPEIIKNAPYETVKRFYKDWYRPDMMALVVVGDMDVDMMEKQIKSRFGQLKNPDNTRSKGKYDVPNHKETLISVVSDKEAPFTNVQLMYKHKFDPVSNMKDYRTSIVHRLYNTMLDARLNELSQSNDPPFNFAYTGYSRDVGDLATYSSYAMVPEGGAKRALEVILEENERVLRHGFTESELDRARLEIMTSLEKAFKEKDKTDSRRFAMRYVYNYLDNNPIPSIGDQMGFYEKLMPTIAIPEINALASQWITEENRVVVVTGPQKETTPMPTEAELRQVLSMVSKKNVEAYVDKVSDAPLMATMPTPGKVTDMKSFKDVDVTEVTLSNGVKVVMKPTDFKNDEVQMRAYSPGGSSLISDSDYNSARFTSNIMNQSGIASFDQTQLGKKLTGKTVRVSPYIGERYEGLNGSASPKDLETMFTLINLYFTSPRKDEGAMQSFVKKQGAILNNLISQPRYYFIDQVQRIQSNNHYRRGIPGSKDLNEVEIDKVFNIYQDRFADASDFTFFLVGNFEVEKIKPMLEMYLGSLPSKNRKESWKDVGVNFPKGKVVKELVKGEAPKAEVNMTWHGDFEWTAQNYYDFTAMINVLRIKMRESMREDKGGVYGVGVRGNASQFPTPRYTITVSFNADPPMMQELIETALADIAKAKEIGSEEKELTKVKETQRQGRIKDLKENRFWMNSLVRYYQNGTDVNNISLEKLESYIDKLKAADIKNAANKYFDMNKYVQITMVPEKADAEADGEK